MTKSFKLAALAFGVIALASCTKTTETTIYTANVPQYLSYEELRVSINNEPNQGLLRPGRIMLHNQYILINDYERGIHVYDNSDPANPRHINFINIPGNVDMAIKDDILYADSHVDLVAIDISNIKNATEVSRVNNTLSYTIPNAEDATFPLSKIDETKGVVVGYTIGEVEESCVNKECGIVMDYTYDNYGSGFSNTMISDDGTPVSFAGNTNNVRSLASSSGITLTGSMARFMPVGEYLYVISDPSTVKIYEMNNGQPRIANEFQPWQGMGRNSIETVFKINNNVLFGSTDGMVIYNTSNAAAPTYVSTYQHTTSCDPVVANDKYAYVTLRNGSLCGNSINELQSIDITDLSKPRLNDSQVLTNPYGLSLDDENDLVFVCDGTAGLRVFKTNDNGGLGYTSYSTDAFETYDVITYDGRAHVIGRNGLSQFEYDTDGELVKLSTISLD